MTIRTFITPGTLATLCSVLFMTAFLGCGGSRPMPSRVLPENIVAHPRGTIGVIAPGERSSLPTALRALGIPYHQLGLKDFAKLDLTPYTVMMIDEEALELEEAPPAYSRMLEHVSKRGGTLVLLSQRTKTLQRIAPQVPLKIVSRDVEYRIDLSAPRHDDPIMRQPNLITPHNLDSLSGRTMQLVYGGREARALIAGNLDAPDSSATLLWEPLGKGAVWYLSVPITAYAAAGYEAEQKIIANLVSNK